MLDLYVEISELLGQAIKIGNTKNENVQSISYDLNLVFIDQYFNLVKGPSNFLML